MPKLKYWMALGEHGAFTRDDHYIFQVFFTGQPGDKAAGLMPKYIEADDLEEARRKMHAFVDERIDHVIHMAKLDKIGDEKKKRVAAVKAAPTIPDSDIQSLSIGVPVNADPKAIKSDTEGLLNLEELL
jgi:hypothetical protein